MSNHSDIQAVLFDKHKFTTTEAETWLARHNFHPIKEVHRTVNLLRYRLNDPKKYKNFSYKQLADGVSLVIGYV